jgi:chromosomal replication initiation ATPase DnaA
MAEAHMIIANRLDQGAPVWLTILRDVCEKHDVTRDDLNSRRKTAHLLPPRQEAYYRLREAGYSLKRIANLMGGRDHTTVLHGARVYAERNRTSSATVSGRVDQSGSIDHCPAGVNCARLRSTKKGR